MFRTITEDYNIKTNSGRHLNTLPLEGEGIHITASYDLSIFYK